MSQENRYHFTCTELSASDTSEIKRRISKKYLLFILCDCIIYFLGLFLLLKITSSLLPSPIFIIFHAGMVALILANIFCFLRTKRLGEEDIVKMLLRDSGHSAPEDLYMSVLHTEQKTIFLMQTRPIRNEDIEKNRVRWFCIQSQYDIPQEVSVYMEKIFVDSPQIAVIYVDVIEEQLGYGNMHILDGLMEDGSLKYYQLQEGDSSID